MIFSPWLIVVLTCLLGSATGLILGVTSFDLFHPPHRNR